MLSEVYSNQPLSRIKKGVSLAEILRQVESYCRDCKTSSPMVCVERCEAWKVKNEIVEMHRLASESDHAKSLLNAVKNARRLKLLDALLEHTYNVRELQEYLRKTGCYRSRLTIANAYLKPLVKAGLIKRDGLRYRATFYGRKVHEALEKLSHNNLLPIHSCCYEETVMKELLSGPKTFGELAMRVNPKTLSRILMRLREKGLIIKKPHADYVFYHRVKKRAKAGLSPTEKRVFEAILHVGISARQLSGKVGITLRRTYKYLRRLRAKKLVFALRLRRTYELTEKGSEIANILDKITKLATTSFSVPISVSQR